MKAQYDAALTNDENRKHWALADTLSAKAANNLGIRVKLRTRSRYEINANSYAKGIILSWANNLVGRGPTLRGTTDNDKLNASLERRWAEQAYAIRLPDTLRRMNMAKKTDGEVFALFRANRRLPAAKVDLHDIECDQCSNVAGDIQDPFESDGIHFDADGNPISYDIWKYHPGDRLPSGMGLRLPIPFANHPADLVAHWFRSDRPGQCRGIPETTPALPLFAYLRRFVLATINAAETAALFSVLLKTPLDPSTTEQDKPEFWDKQELVRGMITAMPDGYEAQQMIAQHPSATMADFVRIILREIARCLSMPYHVAAGDYSDSNYSTARLGSQDFRLACGVERQDCEREVLEPYALKWFEEARLIPGYLEGYRYGDPMPAHEWHWPAWDHIDPKTEALADTANLANGTTTIAQICGSNGDAWKETILQSEREKAYREAAQAEARKEYGLAPAPMPAAAGPPSSAPKKQQPPAEPTDQGDQADQNDGQDATPYGAGRIAVLVTSPPILNGKGAKNA